jgi:selenocysteine lyase/cysteine desulfurase
VDDLRAQFPVLERLAYLNAGSNGPVPRAALEAVDASLRLQAEEGRGDRAHFEENARRIDHLRGRVAAMLGCETGELALTGSTTDGVNAALNALDLGPGDDVVTSDQEHPGVLAPLAALRERRGVNVRMVPFAELASAVRPDTRLVACSHVSWRTGAVVDAAALAATSALVLLDGAQGLGAVPTKVAELGCDFYAASGQKWLCGPNGIGYLFARGRLGAELPAPWPNYGVLADSAAPFELRLHPDARRFSIGFPAPHQIEWAIVAIDALERPGLDALHTRARELAAGLASLLGERVAPRGDSTLVSWEHPDPEAEVERLRAEGFVVRNLPKTPHVRASVGAWNSDEEIERLAESATRRG